MIAPVVPGLMTDYMASRRAGKALRCEDYASAAQPAACRDAYSDVVRWSAVMSLANCVLTFLLVRQFSKLQVWEQCGALCIEMAACMGAQDLTGAA